MRIEREMRVAAPPRRVWELVSNPEAYPRLMQGITRVEPRSEGGPGLGARYLLHMRAGSADVGGLVELVEFDECRDMAWNSITGIDQRGRWRLRETDDGGTKVTLRLAYGAPGGLLGSLADRLSAPTVRDHLEQSLRNLRVALGDREEAAADGAGDGVAARALHELGSLKTLIEAGVVRPMRPDRLARIALALARFGRTPAAGYAALAERHPHRTALVDELGALSFAELHRRTNALAHALSDAGLGEGDGIGIMCRNHRGFVEATVAASKLGADALYLNTAFSGPQLADAAKREKPTAIVYDEEFAELLTEAGRRRKRCVAWQDSDDPPDRTLEELIAGGDPADVVPPAREGRTVILTSGTTGSPKGAARSNP
ncbi:MAG TPA: AMP-binding protein, partial [Thermoleophilaceae bacterium]|nr:AMP-binding protein [Thermoleophilaceae bacterium]